MQTYILMTKLTPEVTREMRHRERIGKKWMKTVNEKCPDVKWIDRMSLTRFLSTRGTRLARRKSSTGSSAACSPP